MIPPKSVLLQELERHLPRPAARKALHDALDGIEGRESAFPNRLERALSRHLADEDVSELLQNLGYETPGSFRY